MNDNTARDKPFNQIVEECQNILNHNCHFYQKFTCENCGSRQTIDHEDNLYIKGQCEECGHITNLQEKGCGYMLHGTDLTALNLVLSKGRKD